MEVDNLGEAGTSPAAAAFFGFMGVATALSFSSKYFPQNYDNQEFWISIVLNSYSE